ARAEAQLRQVATPRNSLRGRQGKPSGAARAEAQLRQVATPRNSLRGRLPNNAQCSTKSLRLVNRMPVPHTHSRNPGTKQPLRKQMHLKKPDTRETQKSVSKTIAE
ncbi:MAG: hypothetical protein OXP09_17125, partial [Gammaproteobacteria bacterium]|nr:hypothetical protein [Gammaproteobacteria bacterium]